MAVLTISAGIIAAIKFIAAAGGLTALSAAAFKAGQAIGNAVNSNEREAQDNISESQDNKEKSQENEEEKWFNSDRTIAESIQEKQNSEKDPIPPTTDNGNPTEEIPDNTEKNIETAINGIDMDSWIATMKQEREERWAREDAIRKETQAREDSAYQRAVKDAINSGINPNLINLTPAASGGGITQASGLDETAITEELEMYLKEVEQSFQGSENDKDRIMKAISNIITIVGIFAMAKGKKK